MHPPVSLVDRATVSPLYSVVKQCLLTRSEVLLLQPLQLQISVANQWQRSRTGISKLEALEVSGAVPVRQVLSATDWKSVIRGFLVR